MIFLYERMRCLAEQICPSEYSIPAWGGLTVLSEIMSLLPEERFLYYADSAFAPYGSRTRKEILDRCFTISEGMLSRGVKAIVVACNTATSSAITEMRRRFDLPIVYMEPAILDIRILQHSGIEMYLERLLERVGIRAGKTVLDFGCREGIYARMAARILGTNGRVYALDRDRKVLEELNRLARKEGLPNLVPILTSGNMPLPLRDASMDVVLLYDVLHLIGWIGGESGETLRRSRVHERRDVLLEVFRVSRPSATVSVYCPHLKTHTDVESEEEIVSEFADSGFEPFNHFQTRLIHDGILVGGHILNFTRPGNVS